MKKICIVTTGYASSSPRSVKEADALHAAGYDVRMVFSQGSIESARANDRQLLESKPWRRQAVGWSRTDRNEKAVYRQARLRKFVYASLAVPGISGAACALTGIYPQLAAAVASEPADFYIGHYPAGLVAAASAARKWNARYAFDSEDYHEGEKSYAALLRQVRLIQSKYIPGASYVSAATLPMAERLRLSYSQAKTLALHNVFPLTERAGLDGLKKDRQSGRLSLYWYSQTVGEDRGLQDAIRACGLLDAAEMHVRGQLSEEVRSRLLLLADTSGCRGRLYFHPPVFTSELLSRTAEHDVGLALEQPIDESRSLSVSNKYFFYLLAGIPPAVSDIESQRRIFASIGEGTGFLYPCGDFRALAEGLRRYAEDPSLLARHKQNALEACVRKWNWEMESAKLVEAVSQALGGPR